MGKPVKTRILAALAEGPLTLDDYRSVGSASASSLRGHISQLRRDGAPIHSSFTRGGAFRGETAVYTLRPD